MTVFIALLRAVNVGGTGKLPMSELRRVCESAGLREIRTYIASGNVVFESDATAAEVKARLERQLHALAGKPVGVLVRTAAEMAEVLSRNPFPASPANRTVAIFLDESPSPDLLAHVTGRGGEDVTLGAREVYVRYGNGMARSRLRIPGTDTGTARNMNTIRTLCDMAQVQPRGG
jgi:uncharacterized protein (DUF1697 family)